MLKLYCMVINWKAAMAARLKGEKGALNVVQTVILIAIAVGLAFIFRNKVSELITKVFGSADDAVGKLSEGSITK